MKISVREHRGVTLIELLVTVGIVVSLAAIVAPLGKGMIARSRAVECSKNLRTIGTATMLYAADNQMTLPVTTHQRKNGGKSWTLTLQEYAGGTVSFRCHEDPNKTRGYTYVLNDFLTPNPAGAPQLNYSILSKINRPESTFLFAEAAEGYANTDHFHFTDYYGSSIPIEVFEAQVNVRAHGESANYLFADGHVESLKRAEVASRLSQEGSSFIGPTAP